MLPFLAAVRPSAFLGERFIADLPNHRHSPIEASSLLLGGIKARYLQQLPTNCVWLGPPPRDNGRIGEVHGQKNARVRGGPIPSDRIRNPAERTRTPIPPKALYCGCLPRLASALYHQSTRNISALFSLWLEGGGLFYDEVEKSLAKLHT